MSGHSKIEWTDSTFKAWIGVIPSRSTVVTAFIDEWISSLMGRVRRKQSHCLIHIGTDRFNGCRDFAEEPLKLWRVLPIQLPLRLTSQQQIAGTNHVSVSTKDARRGRAVERRYVVGEPVKDRCNQPANLRAIQLPCLLDIDDAAQAFQTLQSIVDRAQLVKKRLSHCLRAPMLIPPLGHVLPCGKSKRHQYRRKGSNRSPGVPVDAATAAQHPAVGHPVDPVHPPLLRSIEDSPR